MVLAAVWAAGPAPVRLCEGVGTLRERLRIQGEEPRDERVVRGREEMQRDGFAQAPRLARHDSPKRCRRLRGPARSGGGAREVVHTLRRLRLHHHPWGVQVQRRVGTNVHEQAVVQERYVLERRGAERSFPKGSDRAQTVAADQNGVVSKRVQLACRLSRQKAGERLPVHLRRRAVGERCRADEGRAKQVHRGPVTSHNHNTVLLRRRAQNRRPAVHAGVESDDQNARIALLTRQERPIERARHHGPEGLTDVAVLLHCRAHQLQGSSRPLGDPQLPVPVEFRLILFVQRRHRHRARAGLAVVHQLRERRSRHSNLNERDGASVVEGLASEASDDARSRQRGCGQVVPRRDHGGELLRQHVKASLVRVDNPMKAPRWPTA
mmetsp:Transcript_41414/g.86533  ORF Transcript_41414/g.86533 Transcript_41414/m.86533 type:complete len:380 (+) Transcript_41414:508-1647(+)